MGLLRRMLLGSMVTLKLEKTQETAIISAGQMRKLVEWECFYRWWMVMTLLPVIKPVLRLIHETLIVSAWYDRYTISSVNISCNILYIVIWVTTNKKAPIYEIGAIPGKNHPCSGFGRLAKLSIVGTLCQAEWVFSREIFKSNRGRAGDRMPTKTAKKAAVRKVAAKKPAAKKVTKKK